MPIRCGHHGRDLVYHQSIGEVRDCARPSVPLNDEGRAWYALPAPDDEVSFYHLSRSEPGRPIQVRLLNGPGAGLLPATEAHRVIRAIAADPDAAATLYGMKARRCWHCHRPLRTKESRERGKGPDCAKKLAQKLGAA